MKGKGNAKVRKILRALKETARVASVMLDGEEARRMITDRAAHYLANPDPRFRSLAGDYYDVEHERFLRVKKTVMRLCRLLDFRCDAVLWLTLDGLDGKVTAGVRQGTMSRWCGFGRTTVPLEGDLARCIESGEIVETAPDADGETLTVLAPLFDSLGDVVGALELTARHPASRQLVEVFN